MAARSISYKRYMLTNLGIVLGVLCIVGSFLSTQWRDWHNHRWAVIALLGAFAAIYSVIMHVRISLNGIRFWLSRLGSIPEVLNLELPAQFRLEVGIDRSGWASATFFFRNASSDCIRGVIRLKDPISKTELGKQELTESEPLLVGVWGRDRGWWPRDTGTSRVPVSFAFKVENSRDRRLLLECDLEWNFLGTRLETLIPADRVLSLEIVRRT